MVEKGLAIIALRLEVHAEQQVCEAERGSEHSGL